jgi:hypothetical protein
MSLESIVAQVQHLPPEERLRLIKSVVDTLITPAHSAEPRHLPYGEFRGARMSTEGDFSIAEWLPTDREMNSP